MEREKKRVELKDVLLPTEVKPIKYAIEISPHFETFSFDGFETIQLNVSSATSKIVLHAKEIEIKAVDFIHPEARLTAINISLDPKLDTATFTFDRQLPLGSEGKLAVSFVGQLNDQMAGFYRARYTARDGSQQWGGCTQFEPTDARRAFPCWDEPAHKAVFEITLVIPKDMLGLSNMPVVCETVDEAMGQKTIKFGVTPIMSTYIVAWVVGDYDFVEDSTTEGVVVRCYTPVGKAEQGRFALHVGTRALSFFSTIFGLPYPLPKLDMIAITEFAAGAMENWGLVTYREAALLIDTQQSSASRKQGVARTVSHELAHQWFGNLVTMDWWTWLYLNEGFARWIEHVSVNHIFPEWDIWTQFASDVRAAAMGLDAMRSSHAIEVDVQHPAEINEIFDNISYAKGSTVIRMLSYYLTEEVFFTCLASYLRRHSYANATSDDLWTALEEGSGKPVRDIMNSWTKQVGYPVLTFEEGGRKENKQVFKVHQTRFLSNGEKDDVPLWSIPVGIVTEKNPAVQFFLISHKEQEIAVELGEGEWMKVNAGMAGMFRVRYPQERLQLLSKAVQTKALPAVDRLGIQDDLYALAKAGLGSVQDYLSFLANYRSEDDYSVFSDIAANLHSLEFISSDQPYVKQLKQLSLPIFEPIMGKLGWDSKPEDTHLTQLFRALVISRLSSCDHKETVEEAKRRFVRYLADPSSLAPDLRFSVYKSVAPPSSLLGCSDDSPSSSSKTSQVIAHGGAEEYEAVLKLFRESDFSEEKRRCLQALGATRSPELLLRTLEFSFTEEVRTSDVPFPVASVASNPAGRDIAWKFLKDKWTVFDEKFGGGLFIITSIVGACTNNFNSEEKAKEIEAFFAEHPVPAAERRLKQSLEHIRNCAAFLAREAPALNHYLGSQ